MPLEPPRAERGYALTFLACASAALVPIWSVRWLPMVDLPQHAAQAAMWLHLRDPAFGLGGRYAVRLRTPYLLGPLLVRALVAVLAPVTAARVAVSAAVVGLPLAADRLLRAAGGDPWWSLASFPASYGVAFHWGFLPYLLAVPLAVLLVAAAFRHGAAPTRRSAVALAALAAIACAAHAMAFAAGAAAGALVVFGLAPTWRAGLLRALPLAAPVPPFLAWLALAQARDAVARAPVDWAFGLPRLRNLPPMLLGLPPDFARGLPSSDLVAYATLAALVALPLVAGAGWRRGLAYLGPAAAVLAFYLCAPHFVLGAAFVYERFAPFLLAFAAVGLAVATPGARRAGARAALVAVVLATMAVWTVRFRRFDRESRGLDRILEAIAPGRTLIGLPWRVYSAAMPGTPYYLHFDAWAQATRGGVLGCSFAGDPPNVVRYRPGDAPPRTPGVEWNPALFRWRVDGWYEYFLVRSEEDTGPWLFRDADARVDLVLHSGEWWLYRRHGATAGPVASRPR